MNTCRLTINYHALSDQCGDDMIQYAVHIDPINVNAPDWILRAATKNMCADTIHYTTHNLPDMTAIRRAMSAKGLATVVVLAATRCHIENAVFVGQASTIAGRISLLADPEDRPAEHMAAVIDLARLDDTLTTCEQAWEAK